MSDIFDRLAASSPQNATAGRVTARGEHYNPNINYGTVKQFDGIPPMKQIPNDPSAVNLIGLKRGRLTVVGMADSKFGKNSPGARWVVRCVCGTYEWRKTKTLRKPVSDTEDCCIQCDHLRKVQFNYKRLGARAIDDFINPKTAGERVV